MKEKTYTCKGLSRDAVLVRPSLTKGMVVVTVGSKDEERGVMGLDIFLSEDALKSFAYVLINFFNDAPTDFKYTFPCSITPEDEIKTAKFEEYLVLYCENKSVFLSKKQALNMGIRLLKEYERSL